MRAIIYQPTKNAMQSGRANAERWCLEFDQEAARRIEPLMGWTSNTDMRQEVSLLFEDKDAAKAFCDNYDIPYDIKEPKRRRIKAKSYADNFSYFSVRGPGTEPIDHP